MSKIESWVTKVPRLKNSKVARFSYRAEAYANDDIEGVDSYDYARDMNVPLATHTDFEASMLSIGARTNFSSVPKNGLNHFFGRVSYNLNKVIDFLSDFLDDFRVQGVETLRKDANFTLGTYLDGKKIRIANTHATNTITCTLPSGQTMNGNGTISIPAGRIIDIELIGTTWKDNLTGNLVGNAGTATKLATPRKIGSVDFDGSADIEIPIENYSTTEKRIGTWIDGKPLYRKVVNLGTLPNATTKSVMHGISNIGFLKLYGYAYSSTGVYASLPFLPRTALNQAVDTYVNSLYIYIECFLDRSNYTGVAVLEYTKTTD